jgi:nitroreductase
MSDVLSGEDLDLIFRKARTHNVWLDKPVEDALLRQVYDLAKMGPTSANMCPMRIIFVKSREAKERLKPALDPGNVDKTMKAPRDRHHRDGYPLLREAAQAVPSHRRQGVVHGPAGDRAGVCRAKKRLELARFVKAQAW